MELRGRVERSQLMVVGIFDDPVSVADFGALFVST